MSAPPAAADPAQEIPTRCPRCGQHFSAEGRFCPFDSEPLVPATEWDPSGDPLLGQTVDGRYVLEAVIGEGGMGRVYSVHHVSLGKRFAMKALREDLAADPEITARFIQEARAAARVNHTGLVQISDFGHLPSGQAYFVMELLEGLPLGALLRRYGALPVRRSVLLAQKIASALEAAHQAGVVHRDLKPDNIHVLPLATRDDVKVVDFGLAKVAGSSRLTRKGVVFGTPYYMSPEQASGEPVDERADIYALGIVLYEMLTGKVPFEADTYMGVLTKQISMNPLPPSALLGDGAQLGAVEDVVLRCLEKKPERRFASMAALHAALSAAIGEPLPSSPAQAFAATQHVEPAPVAEREARRSPWGLNERTLPLAGLLILVSVLLGVIVTSRMLSPQPLPEAEDAAQNAVRGDASATRAVPVAAPITESPPRREGVSEVPVRAASAREAAPPSPQVPSPPSLASRAPSSRSSSAPAPKPAFRPDDIVDPWAK